MTRLNVEDLEGRALMSATVVAVAAPTATDAAVVRVVETDTGAVQQASEIPIRFYDLLISSFKDSGRGPAPFPGAALASGESISDTENGLDF